jgi:hypothetical protein
MANIAEIQVSWTGFPGSPGVSTFYSDASVALPLAAIRTFFDTIKTRFPSVTNWTFPGVGDIFDSATGALVGSWAQAAPAVLVATGSAGNWVGPAGACVNWQTSTIVPPVPPRTTGHRLRGRTFLVPFDTNQFDNGSLVAATVTNVLAASTALVAAAGADLRVWHRPVAGAGGVAGAITGATVPDKAVVLRSRRP